MYYNIESFGTCSKFLSFHFGGSWSEHAFGLYNIMPDRSEAFIYIYIYIYITNEWLKSSHCNWCVQSLDPTPVRVYPRRAERMNLNMYMSELQP